MVNEFCGFEHGVIGKDRLPADTTLNNMKKADLIKLLHIAQHNYESLMWFYNNAVKFNEKVLNGGGWIPVSERLPEEKEHERPLYDPFSLAEVDNERHMESDLVNVTVKDWECDEVFVCDDCTVDGKWVGFDGKQFEVIAWQPLPEPYKESEG